MAEQPAKSTPENDSVWISKVYFRGYDKLHIGQKQRRTLEQNIESTYCTSQKAAY